MRKLLFLSVMALLTTVAGCSSGSACGDRWQPGYYLFGWGRHPQAAPAQCCDPCGGTPVMAPAPCYQ